MDTSSIPDAPAWMADEPAAVEPAPSDGRALQFVMKISRYCNLRCTYCYESAYLGDKRRMGLEQLAGFFASVGEHARRQGIGRVSFTWHGGEPLMVPLTYYEAIGDLQKRLMPGLAVTNGVQTNLTILTDAHLEFLRTRAFFDRISISFDVSGDQRVDKKGRPTTAAVLGNMQRLLDAGLSFGSICVLARNTAPRVVDIFTFFQSLGTNCRFLPFHSNTEGTGEHSQALPQADIVAALNRVLDTWMQVDDPVPVRPLSDLMDMAGRALAGAPRRVWDKETDEWTFVVDPDGELWGISEIEDHRFRYGNVFRSGLGEVLASEARTGTFAAARQRIDTLCAGCPYLGHCSGYPMADIADGLRGTVEREGCHRRGVLDHIVARLHETGLADVLQGTPGAAA